MTKHGMSHSRLNKIWRGMRQRCNNPNDQAYENYGGKGIQVCEEWQEFIPFMEWATANGYQDNLTIDRLDSSKGYVPDNCEWVTRAENTRRAKIGKPGSHKGVEIEFNGKSLTLRQWAAELGVSYATLYQRINVRKLPLDEALQPGNRSPVQLYSFKGQTKTLVEWASQLNIPANTLDQRINRLNWPIEKALSKDKRAKKVNKPKIDPQNVTAFGETLSIAEWADRTELTYIQIYQRLAKGKPPEEALSAPVRTKRKR